MVRSVDFVAGEAQYSIMKSRNVLTFDLLDQIGEPDASQVSQLIEGLRRAENFQRDAYCDLLSEIGAPAVPALVELLRDPDPDIRWHGVHALGDIEGAPEATRPGLLAALGDSDEGIRVTAALALAKCNAAAEQAVPVLLHCLENLFEGKGENDDYDDECMRIEIVYALGRFSPPAGEMIEALIEALNDPSVNVQEGAAVSLGQHGPAARAAVDRLRELAVQPIAPCPLTDETFRIAWRSRFDSLAIASVHALGRIVAEYHEDVLIRLIQDPQAASYDRAKAIDALIETPFTAKVAKALRQAADESGDPYIKQRIEEALLSKTPVSK
jgi:HEAT repeat protein